MMPAAKHGDPQMGVDIHLCVVPPSPSPVPLPTPHLSIVFDPFDYVPFLGATVTVCGMKRAVAGTAGVAVHIPPGFPFAPKLPDKDDELFMGSATVEADGDPFSFLAVPVLSCQVVGMPSPPRPKRKGGPRVCMLPLTFNLAIPTNVFVGGPPTISLMGMAFKVGFAALGKVAKSRFARALGEHFAAWRKAKFGHLNPGFLKCSILRAEPVNIVTGAVSVEQEDFTLPGLIPVRWTRRYASDNARRGACGVGWECPVDARLEHDAESGVALFHHPEGGIAVFPAMPEAEGDAAAALELMDGALLSDHGAEWRVRTKEDRIYRFPKSLGRDAGDGAREYPLWQVCDLCGNALTWERDATSGRPTALVEAAGRRIELGHGPDGLIRRVALHVPESGFRHVYVEYEPDAAGDLAEVRDALGNPYRFAYDRHRMVRHTDRNGLSFHYEYARFGDEWRVVRSWGDGGLYAYRFAYLDAVNERKITDSLGHVSVVKLDERGLPISEIDALGGVTIYEYDEAGRTTAVVDQDGHRTEYAFDERGNLTRLVRADGSAVEVAFDAASKAVAIVDPNGGRWTQRWNAAGLLIEHATPQGHLSRFEYDGRGAPTGFTDPRGSRTDLRHDDFGNLLWLRDALGFTTSFSYDPLGGVVLALDPLRRETHCRYDVRGLLVGARSPGGAQIACAYDAEGNLTRFRDANGAETRLEYVGLGEIAARLLPDGGAVRNRYDTEERLVAITNQRGETFSIDRDPLGRVVAESDFWGQRTTFRLTAAGLLSESRDPLGRIVRYARDALGRTVRRTLVDPAEPGDEDEESFEFDRNGNLLSCANAAATVARRYDAENRLVEERIGADCVVVNSFDAAGNRVGRSTSRTLGDRRYAAEVRFAYDALNQFVRAEVAGHAPIELARDALGLRVEERCGAGTDRRLRYDADGFLSGQRISTPVARLEQAYRYDATGNPVERTDSVFGTERFTYDPIGRLLERAGPAAQFERHVSDLAGDRLPTRADGPSADRSPLDAWRREGEYQGTHYRFDRAGNLVQRQGAGPALRLAWNAHQRLCRASGPGSTTAYAYDPLGRRVRKSSAAGQVRFLWDGDALLGDHATTQPEDGPSSVTAVREWVHYPGTFEPLAMLRWDTSAPGGAPEAPVLYRYINDPNGCPTRLLDPSGAVVWEGLHSAWGAVEETGAREVENPIRLQGQYHDAETGLHYNLHRYWEPGPGQFVSIDPIGLAGGIQLYAPLPNVLCWIDPLGLNCGLPKDLRRQLRKIEEMAATPGNKGIRAALSPRELRKVGEAFVGEGHTIARGARHGELWLISADGKRMFRSPTPKSSPFARTGKQANFHQRGNINHNWFDENSVSNVHAHAD